VVVVVVVVIVQVLGSGLQWSTDRHSWHVIGSILVFVIVSYLQKSNANICKAVFTITPTRCELMPGERIQVVIEGCICGSVVHLLQKSLMVIFLHPVCSLVTCTQVTKYSVLHNN